MLQMLTELPIPDLQIPFLDPKLCAQELHACSRWSKALLLHCPHFYLVMEWPPRT